MDRTALSSHMKSSIKIKHFRQTAPNASVAARHFMSSQDDLPQHGLHLIATCYVLLATCYELNLFIFNIIVLVWSAAGPNSIADGQTRPMAMLWFLTSSLICQTPNAVSSLFLFARTKHTSTASQECCVGEPLLVWVV